MPNLSTLTSEDKQTIKKCIPRPTNKIITAAVARLYVAHPNPNEWRFTGISGAIVFTYDVIGNTLFLKMVDISVCMALLGGLLREIRAQIEVLYGIRNYTKISSIIRIEHSFIRSNWRYG